jgi:hypothetical protein
MKRRHTVPTDDMLSWANILKCLFINVQQSLQLKLTLYLLTINSYNVLFVTFFIVIKLKKTSVQFLLYGVCASVVSDLFKLFTTSLKHSVMKTVIAHPSKF